MSYKRIRANAYITETESINRDDIYIWTNEDGPAAYGKSAKILCACFPGFKSKKALFSDGRLTEVVMGFPLEPVLAHFIDKDCLMSVFNRCIHITKQHNNYNEKDNQNLYHVADGTVLFSGHAGSNGGAEDKPAI